MTTVVVVKADSEDVKTVTVNDCTGDACPAEASNWTQRAGEIQYHYAITDDDASNGLLPWYSPGNRGASYDHMLDLVFEWWLAIEQIAGEPDLPYYIMHMRWQAGGQSAGTGGDQIAMAISSWLLYYAYTGDDRALDDCVLMADTILANALSASDDDWPYLPFPYQMTRPSGLDTWDGDFVAGEGYLQPDKAGSFGLELIHLYKAVGTAGYLTAAVNIANTLASKVVNGDLTNSPLPYRVRASDGDIYAAYTSNFCPTLELFEILTALNQGNVSAYATAKGKIISWFKNYAIPNEKFGPFFEDVSNYSDTAINAGTLAMYILNHRDEWSLSWDEDVRTCLDWVGTDLRNEDWISWLVWVVNEQTVYLVPGQSHSSRQASIELLYAELTGDTTRVANAIRQLSWATYMVNNDGENTYFSVDTWLTDGYGDFIRHFIRAMAAAPYLAPANENHLLRSSSVVKSITYGSSISYETYDASSREKLRVTTFTPTSVTAGGTALTRRGIVSELDTQDGWTYDALGGYDTELNIKHSGSGVIVIS